MARKKVSKMKPAQAARVQKAVNEMISEDAGSAMQKTTIRLPADLIHTARIRAAIDKVDFQDVVKLALEDYLKSRKGR